MLLRRLSWCANRASPTARTQCVSSDLCAVSSVLGQTVAALQTEQELVQRQVAGDCTCQARCFSSCQRLWAIGSGRLASLTGCSCAALGLTCQPSRIQASHQSAELGVGQHWRVCQEGAPREGVVCDSLLQAAASGRGTWQGRGEDVNSCQLKSNQFKYLGWVAAVWFVLL